MIIKTTSTSMPPYLTLEYIQDKLRRGNPVEINTILTRLNLERVDYKQYYPDERNICFLVILMYQNYNLTPSLMPLDLEKYEILLLCECIDIFKNRYKNLGYYLGLLGNDEFNEIISGGPYEFDLMRHGFIYVAFNNSNDFETIKLLVETWSFIVCIAKKYIQKKVCESFHHCFNYCHPIVRQSIRDTRKLKLVQKSGRVDLLLPDDIQAFILDFV